MFATFQINLKEKENHLCKILEKYGVSDVKNQHLCIHDILMEIIRK